MGIFSSMFEQRANNFMDLMLSSRGVGLDTATGKQITIHNSMQLGAVFACVRVLAEGEASLPLVLYQREPRGKSRASNLRLFELLHNQPNPEMTSFDLRALLMSHVVAWGNGYAEIQRDRGGRVLALWPLRPDRVDVYRGPDGQLYYRVTVGDPLEHDPEFDTLPWRNVLHLQGLGYDGTRGYSVVAMARQSVALGLATEEFGARFFGNGARPGAVLEHPGKLSDGASARLSKSWNSRHQGLENAHRTAILEEGMKLHEIGIPPEDAQFLETRKFSVEEIARWFRVPPHMIGHLERSTNNNIEHQGLEFVIHTLRPWLVRFEQVISRDLLTAEERRRIFAEHLVDALLRGDIKSRYDAYAQGRQNGWLSANDIREMENMNPVEGGDVYLVPLNMVPSDQLVEMGRKTITAAPSAQASLRTFQPGYEQRSGQLAKSRQRLAASYRRLFEDVTNRVVRREIADIKRALGKYLGKRGVQDFSSWLDQFYQDHREFWQRQIMPILVSYAEQVGAEIERELGRTPGDVSRFITEYAAALAGRESDSSIKQIKALLRDALAEDLAPEEMITARLDDWAETRAGRVARDESARSGNALAWAFYVASAVQIIQWMAVGDSCPYCQELDGRVIGIQEVFLKNGTDFQPEGADAPLSRRHDIRHGPLHDGCDCVVIAG